ncbi:Transcriptional regulatory rxt2 protein [Rutstroemia sp. NJR-2017a WRK4]|nr:Transcriptional regulatory rxt2 protein [Rutstroemia sp. NJR-2017a WRK4]
MASQAAIFADTIAAMKKAVKRKSYDSDSDSSIERLTNRGNKLRKRARYVHQGQLAPPTGPQVYRETIEYAGYTRDIISRKPPLVDEDGYEIGSDEDEERAEAIAMENAEFDPYADIKLEELLAPLTTASELPDHPSLSQPFKSKVLTELTRNAGEMVQKEMESLWKIKHLLTKFSGHHTWMPCETVETENDVAFFETETERQRNKLKRIAGQDMDIVSSGTLPSEDGVAVSGLMIMGVEGGNTPGSAINRSKGKGKETEVDVSATLTSTFSNGSVAGPSSMNGPDNRTGASSDSAPLNDIEMQEKPHVTGEEMDLEVEDTDDMPIPRRMRTRAQAQAVSDGVTDLIGSISPDPDDEPYIHPYFLAPESSIPDRDLYLPKHEAEELRKLLQLYIQKQEEIIRGAQRVYEGLLKADRLRHLVMKWAKAEGHVGANRDMSDGEDWYDKEEWGLDEDLKKGQDEEEEDAVTTAKKTRTRRQ